jgi:hypothetical protein
MAGLPPELLAQLNAPEAPAGLSPDVLAQLNGREPSLGEKVSTGVRRFFDPGYGSKEPAGLGNVGKQLLKAGAFLVPGTGLGSMAASGALYGAGASDATDVRGMAQDAVLGGAGGVVLGGALKAGGRALKPVGEWLGKKSLELGRKALSGIGTPLSAKKLISPAAVEQAYASGAIRPLSTVTGIATRLGETADDLGMQYGQILKTLEAKGIYGPEAEAMAQKLLAEAQHAAQNSIIGTRANALQGAAEALQSKALPVGGKGRLGLMQSELMKRELQTEAKNDFVREGRASLSGAARKELAGTWRRAIEDAVQQQASLAPTEAAAFEPVKNRLAATLEGLQAAETGAARAARRKAISLTDTIAGAATGAATASPLLGGAGALLHGLADRRLASTGGWLARQGARGTGALSSVPVPRGVGATGPAISPQMQAMAEAIFRRFGRPGLVPGVADEESSK